jgi:hypothetical protein
MQAPHRRQRDGDSFRDPAACLLRSRLTCSSSEQRPELEVSITAGTLTAVRQIDRNPQDANDVVDVNAYLNFAFQSPHASPTTDSVPLVQVTPGTILQSHSRCLSPPLRRISPSQDQHDSFQTPVRTNAMAQAIALDPHLDVQYEESLAMTNSPLHFMEESGNTLGLDEYCHHPQSDLLDLMQSPLSDDDPVGELQYLARTESPSLDTCAPQDRSALFQTPARDSSVPFRPQHSPIGKLPQYSPSLAPSTTPTPGRREPCVPCPCPSPKDEVNIFQYRRKYKENVYPANIVGNGSVPNQSSFFPNAVHNGLPVEYVKLSLEVESSQGRKQRIADHAKYKVFQGGVKKKGGPPSAESELLPTELVDVQLTSAHHPQYCLQLNNFLPRMHELRRNFHSFDELYRHICPLDTMDEAIPRLLLLPSLQDNWAIALLVRFTTFSNPLNGVQTDTTCFVNAASSDFDKRSGNHIMRNEGDFIKFGAIFPEIPLPTGCVTNRTLPQLCELFPSVVFFLNDHLAGSCVKMYIL